MDKIDKKILCELDLNCSNSFSQIARKLKLSRNIVAYRINNLEKEGIITKYICSLNLGLLGYRTYKIYFRINTNEKDSEVRLIKNLKENPSVIHLLKLEGDLDYSLTIAVKSIKELDNILTDLKTAFPNLIKDYSFSLVVYSRIFKLNKTLLGEKKEIVKFEKYSGEDELFKIDKKDELILKVLSEDANMSIVDLAEKTKLSLDIVKYRLKILETKLITSYRALFDFGKLGFFHYTLMLKTKQFTKKDEERLLSWCNYNPNTLYFTKRIGTFDFEINFVVSTITELTDFLSQFKENFGDVLESYNLVVNTKLIKINYTPFENFE